MGNKVQFQRVATTAIVAQPGNLFQPATAIFPAITGNLIAKVFFSPLTTVYQIGDRFLICRLRCRSAKCSGLLLSDAVAAKRRHQVFSRIIQVFNQPGKSGAFMPHLGNKHGLIERCGDAVFLHSGVDMWKPARS